jgi:hypothetical protein
MANQLMTGKITMQNKRFKGLLALGVAGLLPLAQAEVSPSVQVEQKYNDNIYKASNNEVNSWITTVRPGVSVSTQRGGSEFELGANTEAGYYTADTRNDYIDWSGYGSANIELDKRNQVGVLVKQSHKHDDIGSGASEGAATLQASPDEYDQLDGDMNYTFGAKDAKGRLVLRNIYMDKDYTNNPENTKVLDRSDNEYRATTYLRVAPKTSLLLEGREKTIDYNRDNDAGSLPDSDETRAFVGAEWEATAKTTGSVRLGHTRKDFDAAAMTDYSLPSWEAIIDWSPRSYSTFTLDSSQGAMEATSGRTFIFRTSNKLDWNHKWSSHLSSNAFLQGYKDEYKGTARQDYVEAVGAGLTYRMTDQLDLSTKYTYEDRESSNVGLDAVTNTVLFGLNWKME